MTLFHENSAKFSTVGVLNNEELFFEHRPIISDVISLAISWWMISLTSGIATDALAIDVLFPTAFQFVEIVPSAELYGWDILGIQSQPRIIKDRKKMKTSTKMVSSN